MFLGFWGVGALMVSLGLNGPPLASERMSYPKALCGRFEPRQDLPDWMRVPRWCTRDAPLWEKGATARWIQGFADRHAQVVRLGMFWGGFSHYPSAFAPPSPNLQPGTDPLAEALEVVRRRGMRLLAYINPNAFYQGHPLYDSACIVAEDGKPWEVRAYGREGTRYACINNPAWADFYGKAIRELLGKYGVDGIYVDGLTPHLCYCPHCRRKFREDTGRDLPSGLGAIGHWAVLWEMTSDWDYVGDIGNPDHALYSRWLMKCLTDATRLFTQTAKSVRPEAIVVFHTWPKPDTLPFYDGTLNEIYATRPWHFSLWKRAEFSNWGDVFEVPSLVNIYLHQRPWGKEERPIVSEAEARHLYWQVLAHGGFPNAWDYPGVERPFQVMERYADCFDFPTTLPTPFLAFPRPMFTDARHREVARRAPSPTSGPLDRFLSPAAGMFAALLHAGWPMKEMHPNHINRQSLQGFRVLVLANEVCLSEEQCAVIGDFVRNGGGLLATHETSLYDLQGQRRTEFGLAEVFGVSYRGVLSPQEGQRLEPTRGASPLTLPRAPLPNHEEHLWVEPKGARVAAWLTGPGVPEGRAPAVVLHEFGEGRVAYLPGRLDSSYSLWGHQDLGAFAQWIDALLEWLSKGEAPARVISPKGLVGVTCFDQPSRLRRLLHLVAYNADWSRPFDELPPLTNVRLLLSSDRPIASVRALLSQQRLPLSRRGRAWEVTLPRLEEYEILEVRFSPSALRRRSEEPKPKEDTMSTISLPFEVYREKVLGCWLGKAVGGTLGGPVEGRPGPLALTYYDPVPDRMLPNDDLDLQVVWLETIRRRGLPIERRTLADAWLEHIHFWPDEYGVACRNLTLGLFPPLSGAFDNGFTAGMGAAIRTELWACLAPGDPPLAAALAREDACVDHAEEGVYAAVYLAALQSAAFVENDRERLLDTAASFIPPDCRVARAIADTRRWWAETGDWQEVRRRILAEHGRPNFTDVAQNLAFIVLGWLAGGEDFGRAICTAVNCGMDTDCTGATLGALLGLLNPQGIGQEWLRPIGKDLVLSPGIVGMQPPATLEELTDRVAALAVEVLAYYGSPTRLTSVPPLGEAKAGIAPPRLARPEGVMLRREALPTESLVATEPLVVSLRYPPQVAWAPRQKASVGLGVKNPSQRRMAVRLRLRGPNGWQVEPAEFTFPLEAGQEANLSLSITSPPPEAVRTYRNPLDLRFEAEGLTWTVTAGLPMTIPWRRWPLKEPGKECPPPPPEAETMEVPGHFLPLPEGPWAFVAEFKLPYRKTLRYVVQAPREVWVWLDGELIHHHDGAYRVPAIHRAGRTGKDVLRSRGWHRLTIAVGEGEAGHLFVALGDGESWDWLRDAEWRLPL